MDKVRIGLLQASVGTDIEGNFRSTCEQIVDAASKGAQIVCTQELFSLPYFCREQDPVFFDWAQLLPGPGTEVLCALAKEHEIVIVASFFERRVCGVFHNSAVIIDANGEMLGKYRKMHIPQDPGFEEKFYFSEGDLGFQCWNTRYGRIGVIICWDQWFPEAARLTALAGAEIIFCPTAIGWLDGESGALGKEQHRAWEGVQCGHAVANACYFAAINRIGREGAIRFWGQSFVSDFYGNVEQRASADEEAIVLFDCDFKALEAHRRIWPFFRDRRIAAYGDLSKRVID